MTTQLSERTTKMRAIHAAWQAGNNEAMLAIWALSDGYGEQGYIPEQGYDWSGIRDSTAEAVDAMYELVSA